MVLPQKYRHTNFDGDTLVTVCNLDVVNPVVVSPDVDTVGAADVCAPAMRQHVREVSASAGHLVRHSHAPDGEIVHFSTTPLLDNQMELWGYTKHETR